VSRLIAPSILTAEAFAPYGDVLEVAGAPEQGVTYAWSTSDGREIGTKPKLLLRLPRGSHRFELRVRHPDGRWAMDGVHIRVV